MSKKITTEDFIGQAKKTHGNKYDYSKTEYIGANKKVKIRCKKHGEFKQTARQHTDRSYGCPSCKESKGEKIISEFLKENKIEFIRQKTFKNCKYKSLLFFDFYLPLSNICIEYDGRQHYESIDFFGGEKGLKENVKRDKIKNKYCKNNNIKLIRIKYNQKLLITLKKIFFTN